MWERECVVHSVGEGKVEPGREREEEQGEPGKGGGIPGRGWGIDGGRDGESGQGTGGSPVVRVSDRECGGGRGRQDLRNRLDRRKRVRKVDAPLPQVPSVR